MKNSWKVSKLKKQAHAANYKADQSDRCLLTWIHSKKPGCPWMETIWEKDNVECITHSPLTVFSTTGLCPPKLKSVIPLITPWLLLWWELRMVSPQPSCFHKRLHSPRWMLGGEDGVLGGGKGTWEMSPLSTKRFRWGHQAGRTCGTTFFLSYF